MEFYCENSYVQTGKCQHCVNPANGNDKLIQAVAPYPFAVHSYFSASVVAEILYNKYVLALPLNRQAQNWQGSEDPSTFQSRRSGNQVRQDLSYRA